MSWVWEQSRAEGTDRLILLAIADSANDDGGNAFPSIETLSDKAKVSERTVQRSVRSLVLLGELQVIPNAGRNGTNVYRVRMDPRQSDTPVNLTPPSESHPRQSDGVTPGASGGDNRVTPGVTPVSPEPSFNQQRTVQKNSSSVAARPDVERVCEHLADRIEANGSKRPNVTDRWRTAARLLIDLDKRTEQQIHAAIEWCQSDDFWRANVLSMPKLRQKYDQLRLAAQRSSSSSQPNQQSTADQRVNAGLTLAAELRREQATKAKELSA